MSIASEITRLQGAKTDLKTAIENKGVLVPSSALLDDYDTYVGQIQTGGGGTNLQVKSVTITTNTTTTVTPDTGYDGMTAVEVITNVSGGITPTGTINITTNGTVDVTNYANASVAVTNYVPDGYIEHSIQASNWTDHTLSFNASTVGKTVDITHVSIGLSANSTLQNTTDIVNAKISVVQKSYDSSNERINMMIRALNIPTNTITLAIFGVTNS